jgi:hypothetical protein
LRPSSFSTSTKEAKGNPVFSVTGKASISARSITTGPSHDVHMTNLVGTACYLAANRSLWQGTLMLVGQSAEEKGAGSEAMLEDGLFKRFPKPDFAIALHVYPALATGKIGIRSGFSMANIDTIDITLHGKGGHGDKAGVPFLILILGSGALLLKATARALRSMASSKCSRTTSEKLRTVMLSSALSAITLLLVPACKEQYQDQKRHACFIQ